MQPVTAPIASGLCHEKEDSMNIAFLRIFQVHIKVMLSHTACHTHIFGRDFLHKSMPDRFAAINISPRFCMEYFVVKYAHIEYAQFIPSVAPILK